MSMSTRSRKKPRSHSSSSKMSVEAEVNLDLSSLEAQPDTLELEEKLKSRDENERLSAVSLIGKMFSAEGSKLAEKDNILWQAFLGRFVDISTTIRAKCVEFSKGLLEKHPDLRESLGKALKSRLCDGDASVRLATVKTIVTFAIEEDTAGLDIPGLLHCVGGRTLDKKYAVKEAAILGLARIYKTNLMSDYLPMSMREAMPWIKDKILHAYYLPSLDDKVLVESMIKRFLIPFELPSRERMLKLLYFYGTIDENSKRAFLEIQKNMEFRIRRSLTLFLDCVRNFDGSPEFDRQLNMRISHLKKFLTDPTMASEFLPRFARDLKKDSELMDLMESLLSSEVDCETSANIGRSVLTKLGANVKVNWYRNTIKNLLLRTTNNLLDQPSLSEFLTIIHQILDEDVTTLEIIGLSKSVALERAIQVLNVFALVFASIFTEEHALQLITLLQNSRLGKNLCSGILQALSQIGKVKPLYYYGEFQEIEILDSICQDMFVNGTPKQVKGAIRCLYTNIDPVDRASAFTNLVLSLQNNLDPRNENYVSAIVGLGQISLLLPEDFRTEIKSIVSKKLVNRLLNNPARRINDEDKNMDESWCAKDDLPKITLAMVVGIKALVHWTIGYPNDQKTIFKTLEILRAFMKSPTAYVRPKIAFSTSEESWLRLSAGLGMLKLCRTIEIRWKVSPYQFLQLSQLLIDKELEVRVRFAKKLHMSKTGLPTDYLGIFVLANFEEDKNLKVTLQQYYINVIRERRERLEMALIMLPKEQAVFSIGNITPEYLIVFAIPILANSPNFDSIESRRCIKRISTCISFILQPLLTDNVSFVFCQQVVERIKKSTYMVDPEDEEMNSKIYIICDLIMLYITENMPVTITTTTVEECQIPPLISKVYFTLDTEKKHNNRRSYLPQSLLNSPIYGKRRRVHTL